MQTTHRSASGSRLWLASLVTGALSLGSFATAALNAAPAGASTGKKVTVSVQTIGKNKVLVANGKPLYFLTTPSSIACGSGCLKVWPALTLPAGVQGATAGSGVQSAKLGTTAGPNGLMQVTYNGQPVYWFAYDKVRGKVKGNVTDKWGKWNDVVVAKSSSSSGSGSGGGSGNNSSGNSGSNSGSGGAGF